MFEKSLYDLIRGLRHHKGGEREYIRKSLKECRAEIRSQDMDVKATALLKLVYLEMVGHDMSWAAFHVLEVMSSPKYHQKRVGYLGAVQSFRADTEVLMLATNLLKKDVAAAIPTVMSLPIATLPHIVTPSLALSILPDLLPRMSHSHPNIRKKAIVTLYRLALVYPEALRAAWPKIKERLMDPDEDSSVTAAIVNVICELGWRRPHDFLPLAPRLFELLVDGGNNWMAIKLIKLFATLTPLEPRLVKKLLPPLTDIIKTTPAMSLLYECINGIIQGGILNDDVPNTDEIASLCVHKLRGMIMMNGDPNLKYVALLAFNKIVATHSYLVAEQEDVILDCIDSPDITIRIQALDLFQEMVTSNNLVSIVSRLIIQLKSSASTVDPLHSKTSSNDPSPDSDDDTSTAPRTSPSQGHFLQLPESYRLDVIARILYMAAKDNYANISDFDWYIDVLLQLVRMVPIVRLDDEWQSSSTSKPSPFSISDSIGNELRNVAVKVKAMRSTVVRAVDDVVMQLLEDVPSGHKITTGTLRSIAWILGEYARLLVRPEETLNCLLQLLPRVVRAETLAILIQAITKVFSASISTETEVWSSESKSQASLFIARILHAIEKFSLHPNLEVQERAIEFIELLKLSAEAVSAQPASTIEIHQDPPLLLTQAIPALFRGWELNSVAQDAQFHVPISAGLDLDMPIHPDLIRLLDHASDHLAADTPDTFEAYYHQRPPPLSLTSSSRPAITLLEDQDTTTHSNSYQYSKEDSYIDADILAKRKAERMQRNEDDPFYIPSGGAPQETLSIHNILRSNIGPDLDIDSIPIMQLNLEKVTPSTATTEKKPRKTRQVITISADETIPTNTSGEIDSQSRDPNSDRNKVFSKKMKQSLLQVDSSSIGSFNLDETAGKEASFLQQHYDETEMTKAIQEVERLRLEMQRNNERINVAQGVDVAGAVIKKKKKKKPVAQDAVGLDNTQEVTKRKKVKKVTKSDGTLADPDVPLATNGSQTKKKKKRVIVEEA